MANRYNRIFHPCRKGIFITNNRLLWWHASCMEYQQYSWCCISKYHAWSGNTLSFAERISSCTFRSWLSLSLVRMDKVNGSCWINQIYVQKGMFYGQFRMWKIFLENEEWNVLWTFMVRCDFGSIYAWNWRVYAMVPERTHKNIFGWYESNGI